jgi:hypothetical protein
MRGAFGGAVAEEIPGLWVPAGADGLALWNRHIPLGARMAFLRFERRSDLPLATVQRLARRAELLVDAHPDGPEDALDLAVAGAAGVVAWLHLAGPRAVEEMADALGEGFLLGCRQADLPQAQELAGRLDLPVLLEGDGHAPPLLRGYLLAREGSDRFRLSPFGGPGAAREGEVPDG